MSTAVISATRRRLALALPAAASVILAVPATGAAAATGQGPATGAPPPAGVLFHVTSTADAHDANPGDGRCAATTGGCTLRAAVQEAAAQPAGTAAAIDVRAGTYLLSLGSLDLSGGPVTVAGAGARATVIRAAGRFRVLAVGHGVTASLAGVTITGGRAGDAGYGGGVLSAGRLRISDSVVSGNRAAAGGGIANAGGTLTVIDSAITGNHAPYYGGGGIQNGGIANLPGTVELTGSTVAANTADGDGGGILDGQNGHPRAAGLPAEPVRSACPRIPRCAGPLAHGTAAPARTPAPHGLRLIVTGSTIADNTGTNGGAGIANDGGTAVVINSTLSGNDAADSPGGAVSSYGPLTLRHDTLRHNEGSYGGAVEASYAGMPGQQFITGSTLADNRAAAGGAIDDSTGSLHVTASTLAGNTARVGGAMEVEGASFFYLLNSTLTGNSARAGAGGAIDTYGCGGGIVSYTTIAGNSSGLNLPCSNLQVTGTILASSAPGPNCLGMAPHESAGYNLDSGTSCRLAKPTDLTGGHPRLGPLADNGGATQTRMPAPGSAAIGHGGTRATGCPATDQRGVPRLRGQACDIGAVEVRSG
jgi:CSLREA domain-containing protein